MLDEVEVTGRRGGLRRAGARPRRAADGLRPQGLPRRRIRAHASWPPHAREIDAPRLEVAEKLEAAALASLKERSPDRVLATNVEFWSAVVLDYATCRPDLFTPMFTCARVAGWSAHILEQKREGRLVRPTAAYVGPGRALPTTCERSL